MARYCTRSGRLRASSHSSASPATCVGAVPPPAAAARSCGVAPVRLLHGGQLDVESCSMLVLWIVARIFKHMIIIAAVS